jgi:hypothetical protein
MSISSTDLYGSATIVNTDIFEDVSALKKQVTTLSTYYVTATQEYVCMYVICMYVYTYECMHVCIYIRMYIRMYHTYVHTYIHTYIFRPN